MRREPQSSTIPTPRINKNHGTWEPSYRTGGTYSQHCMMEGPRYAVSKLYSGKFPHILASQVLPSELVSSVALPCVHSCLDESDKIGRNKAPSYRLCKLGRPTLKGGLRPLRPSRFNSAARRSLSCAASSSAVVVVLGFFGRPKPDRSRCNTEHGQKNNFSA